MSPEDGRAGFSPDQVRTLASVLDRIIPPSGDGRLPGAGEIGLAGAIEEALRETPGRLAEVAEGLAALDGLARSRGSEDFSALPDPARLEALGELEAARPEFLPGLVFHTYVGYYQDPRVVEALGLEARPPHPDGYEMEPGDLTLLDDVRRRTKLYREC